MDCAAVETIITTIELRGERDVASARLRARDVAGALLFEQPDRIRLATAVSEIARELAGRGKSARIEFVVTSGSPSLSLRVVSLNGGFGDPPYPPGTGFHAAMRVTDGMEAAPGGVSITFLKRLPVRGGPLTLDGLEAVIERLGPAALVDPFEELRRQNGEFVEALESLEARQAELRELNRELEETNRGVVALYAELDDKAASLEAANAAKTRFLSNMTHEFRTPLNSILSLARMLLDRVDGPLEPEQERQVVYIRRSAQELSDMVNDLLDIAKVEAGRVPLRASPFLVADLFAALRGMFRPLLPPGADLDLVFEPAEHAGSLDSDEGKISQILRNFISNALKFTPRGEVRVRARALGSQHVVFEVTDTGVGIAPADRERIFEEFIQLDSAPRTDVRGTGLGLPLARRLATLLGGQVFLESVPGQGSTFSVALPRRSPSRQAASLPNGNEEAFAGKAPDRTAPSGTPGPSEHAPEASVPPRGDMGARREAERPILVIDDNPISRYLLVAFLAECCVSVLEASDAEQGLHLARHRLPRAIFLDLVMPGVDGRQALAWLKADPCTRAIPVILHSSLRVEDDPRDALLEQVALVFPKDGVFRSDTPERLRALLASPEPGHPHPLDLERAHVQASEAAPAPLTTNVRGPSCH